MKTNNYIRALMITFALNLTMLSYAQSDFIYKGLRFNDNDKELQFWNSGSKSWSDAKYNMHLVASNMVKCRYYFRMRHNNRISLYAPTKKATKVSLLKPTYEPKRVRITTTMGGSLFNKVYNYINSSQYRPLYPVEFIIVDQNNDRIETAKAKGIVYLMIFNESDSLLRCHLAWKQGEEVDYDAFDDKNKKDDMCDDLILLPHSVSRYEMSLGNFVGLNEFLLVLYKAPNSKLFVEVDEEGKPDMYYCKSEGNTVSLSDLLSNYQEPNGGLYSVVFKSYSFITTKK